MRERAGSSGGSRGSRRCSNPYEINPFNRGVAIARQSGVRRHARRRAGRARRQNRNALWETQVADSMLGYSLTSAPLIVKDKVLVGITGGEFGARGFLDAYDAATGRRLWRWYAVPGTGRIRQRHVERRQLEARRQPDVADRLVRSRSEHRLLDGRESRRRRSTGRRAVIATTCSAIRS